MTPIKKYRLSYSGLAADLFTGRPWTSLQRPLAIVLSGFPDFSGPTPLTSSLVEAGVSVLQPHMAGTYDSTGEFSPEGCRRTLQETSNAIQQGRLTPAGSDKALTLTPTKISLIGHSFGGIVALRYFSEIAGVQALVFTSAALHYGRDDPDFGCLEDGPEHYRSVAVTHPFTYRLAPAGEWIEILAGQDAVPPAPVGSVRSVRTIYGGNDKYYELDAASRNIPNLIAGYVTARDQHFDIIPDAGHPIAELVSARSVHELMPEVL